MQDGARSLRPHRVDFVNENDARSARLCRTEQIPDPPGTLTDQDLVKLRATRMEKGNASLTGDSASEQGLTCARGSNEEAALG